MVKTRNPKNPEHRYFSVGAIAELDEAGAPYAEFVTAYASYVLQRNKLFTARYRPICVTACASVVGRCISEAVQYMSATNPVLRHHAHLFVSQCVVTVRFEELKVLNNSSTAKKALAALKKAQQLITLGYAPPVIETLRWSCSPGGARTD